MRLAVAQADAADADPAATLLEVAGRAAAAGADLLLAPELVVGGYGAPAAELPADADRTVAGIAAGAGVAVCAGVPVVDAGCFDGAVLADASGRILTTYRKRVLWGDYETTTFAAGDAAPEIVTVAGVRVAIVVCYEVEFPEAVRDVVLRGADVVLVPTANPAGYEPVPTVLVPARACENQSYVAYANLAGTARAVRFGGRSVVAGPDGVIASAAADGTDLLVVDLDVAGLQRRRLANPYLDVVRRHWRTTPAAGD